MCLVIKCRKIVGGLGFGQCLVTRQPINFLTMLDPETGIFHDLEHELHGRSLKSKVLVFPKAISEIPAVDMKGQQFESKSIIRQGTQVLVDADSCHIEIIKKH